MTIEIICDFQISYMFAEISRALHELQLKCAFIRTKVIRYFTY